MKKWIIALVPIAILAFFLLRPKAKTITEEKFDIGNYTEIIRDCVNLCLRAEREGINLDPGPCLSDIYSWNHSGWVCDVAHWPRRKIDNLKENQCKNWWVEAKNFVEVDPECRPIRIYVYGETKEPYLIE